MTTTPTRITHWIDGKPFGGTSERAGDVYDPATGQLTGRVDLADVATVDLTVAAAAGAAEAWGRTSLSNRTKVLFRFRELLDARKDDVAAGQVGWGHQVTALYEVQLTDAGKDRPLGVVRIRHKQPEADAAVGIRFVTLPNTPEALAGLKKEFRTAYIAKAEPSPRYAGVKEPIYVMQYDYTVFASSKVRPEVVSKITDILANNKGALGQAHPLFMGMDVARLYNDIEVPYHDGAKAYYGEKGIKETK